MSFWNSWRELRVKRMNEKDLRELVEEVYGNAMCLVSFLDEDVQEILMQDDEEEENEEALIW